MGEESRWKRTILIHIFNKTAIPVAQLFWDNSTQQCPISRLQRMPGSAVGIITSWIYYKNGSFSEMLEQANFSGSWKAFQSRVFLLGLKININIMVGFWNWMKE